MDQSLFEARLGQLGLKLSAEQYEAFSKFEEALYLHNQVKNLTRIPAEMCWLRHFIDCLLFHDLIPKNATVLDIGTGPGFPAWPLACARPDLQVTAVDSNQKMLDFLISQPLPNLTVLHGRAEEMDLREKFNVVTGRAVAPLDAQLEISAAFVAPRGYVLPMRNRGDLVSPKVLGELGLEMTDRVERELEPGVVRMFPMLKKVKKTPARFPRAWAIIKARPLS